jgi:uncharacterized delta-60 repeat protein
MRSKSFRFILGLILFMALLFTPAAMAADGDLDTAGFGAGTGFVTTDLGSNDYAHAVAVQSDGKIVVAGYSSSNFAVARYNSDGSLDTSFDSDGWVITNVGSTDRAFAIAIQPDGKIVAAGYSNNDFAVARYNSDGSLDATFSGDGMVTTDINSGADQGYAVAIQSDGKIVVAGYGISGGNYDFAVVRYLSDGTLDTSFDSDGKVTTDFSSGNDYGHAMAIQSDGKIVVAGYDSNNDFAVVRYLSDGTLDTTFDSNESDGKVTTNINGTDQGYAVAIQSDGKIVVGGIAGADFGVVRYLSDGTLDSTFSGDGMVTTQFSSTDYGYAVAIQPDGKIVMAGYSSGSQDFIVARYNTDGSLDSTFSGDGKLNTNISGNDRGQAIAIQSDGQIVVAGYSGSNDFAVVRYEGPLPSLQTLIDGTHTGGTLTLYPSTTYVSGSTVNKSLTIDLNGNTVGAGSPAFTVTAANVTVENGTLDGGGDTSPAVLVQSGGDNFTLKETEVTNWADGVEVAADVTSFKLVGNYIHDNADAGLQANADVDFAGIVTIEGNLFKNNTGNGIQNNGNTPNLLAQYNSWGDIDGAASGTGGDGISANVDASNPTFAELFVAVNPGTEDTSREVEEQDTFHIDLNVDGAGLYGLQYRLTYDSSLITLDSISDGGFRGTGACTNDTSTAGVVDVFCYRINPDADGSGTPLQINDLTFTANGSGLIGGVGPWTNHFDLSHLTLFMASGARNGIKVYVNNGGFGAPSQAGVREITDTNDGEIVITVPAARYTGFINLEGRTDDSSVLMEVYDQEAIAGSTLLATATSAADGSYTSAFEGLHKLRLNNSYYFQVDAPLHLPTTASSATNYAGSAELTTQPNTGLNTLVLLGGDATNDDTITLADATCIGANFGTTSSTCSGTGANSDVNVDGQIDLLDLVLMGGNYTKTSSAWTP